MAHDMAWLNQPLDVAERLLMDVAGRIQLSPTQHAEAERNYRALADWVNEGDHPLAQRVTDIYPSGSFAIGAAILGKVSTEKHDVDAVIELDMPVGCDPSTVLKALYSAVRREPGSRYYDTTELNSRCVTVNYSDGRTVDLMPVVRLRQHPEKVSQLFHWNEEKGESYHKEVNPHGFAEHFVGQVTVNEAFQRRFQDRLVLLEKADAEPLPEHQPLQQKAIRVVALQLIKRARDISYRRRKGVRRPPSVVLAALALGHPQNSDYLLDDLAGLAAHIRGAILTAEGAGQTLQVTNPRWDNDLFTDRWPEDRAAQLQYAEDLKKLESDLALMRRGNLGPNLLKQALDHHFGETASNYALNELADARGRARTEGLSRVGPAGAVSVAQATAAPVPKRTPFGGDPE